MPTHDLHPAIFLDKDGTLLENVPYNVNPSLMRFTPGAVEGLRLLGKAGYRLFVITNQSGVAKGLFPESALGDTRQHLEDMLGKEGLSLDGFYYCPHHPEGRVKQYSKNCFCRKPNPGMLFQAAGEHDLNLSRSWFIGDTLNDIECGLRANCGTILLDNGDETEWKNGPMRQPNFTTTNLLEAARIILENPRPPQASRLPVRSYS